MSEQNFFRWNNHTSTILTALKHLYVNQTLVDVTLACDGKSLKAHKLVLSACSPYFQTLFAENPCKHPIVILNEMKFSEVKEIVEFMYTGKVNVSQDSFSNLMKTAKTLNVKGLSDVEVTNETTPSDDELSIVSVIKTDGPPPKRRKRRVRKLSSDQSDSGTSEIKKTDYDIQEVFNNQLLENSSPSPVLSHDKNSDQYQDAETVKQDVDRDVPNEPSKILQKNVTKHEDDLSMQPQNDIKNNPSLKSEDIPETVIENSSCPSGEVNTEERQDLLLAVVNAVDALSENGLDMRNTENEHVTEELTKSSDIEVISPEAEQDSDIEVIENIASPDLPQGSVSSNGVISNGSISSNFPCCESKETLLNEQDLNIPDEQISTPEEASEVLPKTPEDILTTGEVSREFDPSSHDSNKSGESDQPILILPNSSKFGGPHLECPSGDDMEIESSCLANVSQNQLLEKTADALRDDDVTEDQIGEPPSKKKKAGVEEETISDQSSEETSD